MVKIAIFGEFDIVCMQRYIYKTPMLYTSMESSCYLLSYSNNVNMVPCFLNTQNWHAHKAIFDPSMHSCAHLCAHHIVHIYRSCWVSLKSSHQDQPKTEDFGYIMLNNNWISSTRGQVLISWDGILTYWNMRSMGSTSQCPTEINFIFLEMGRWVEWE